MIKLTGDIRRDFERVSAEYTELKSRILEYQETVKELRRSLEKAVTIHGRFCIGTPNKPVDHAWSFF